MTTTTPEPVATGSYPGIEVAYFEKPYRHYTVNGTEAVSVTTALGVINKPLDAWVERMTMRGVWKLLNDPDYELPDNDRPIWCPWKQRKYVPNFARACKITNCPNGSPALCRFHVDLKDRGLTARADTQRAADRGVDVHHVWQMWCERQEIPDLSKYPRDRRGHLRAMADAIIKLQPHAIETEMIVGSVVHGFAGRLDTVVYVKTRKGLSMLDVKTGKAVYSNTYFPQLAGYEIARLECGLEPTVRQGILRLGSNGKHEVRWSNATADDFLAVLAAYKSQKKWERR